jgi:ribose transport system permease protein
MNTANLTATLRRLGPLIALALLLLAGAFVHENFLTWGNIGNVLTRSALIGIIAIGATFVIVSGSIDLSVGAMLALVAGVMILVMNGLQADLGAGLALAAVGLGAGVLLATTAGAVNGALTSGAKIDPFIVTLGTMSIFRSVMTFLADGGSLRIATPVQEYLRPLYFGEFLGLSTPIWAFALTALVATVVLNLTRFGRACYAVGSNAEAARYAGISVGWVRFWAFVIQGLCVGLATLLFVPRLGSASGGAGLLWELEAITAVIVGGAALRGGSGQVWGTVVGVLILGFVANILNLTDAVSPFLNGAIQGAIIVLAVFLQRRR